MTPRDRVVQLDRPPAKPAKPTLPEVLALLRETMQGLGIAKHDATDILQTFATTIAQAQAKAAMRQENTK